MPCHIITRPPYQSSALAHGSQLIAWHGMTPHYTTLHHTTPYHTIPELSLSSLLSGPQLPLARPHACSAVGALPTHPDPSAQPTTLSALMDLASTALSPLPQLSLPSAHNMPYHTIPLPQLSDPQLLLARLQACRPRVPSLQTQASTTPSQPTDPSALIHQHCSVS